MIKWALVDAAIKRYDLPVWVKPYIRDYLKGGDIATIKYAISFVKVGRKKGAVTGSEIILPNGKKFKKEHMAHLLSLFYYGEERISEVTKDWAASGSDKVSDHVDHFSAVSSIEAKRARAIKNLIEGLGLKVEKPTREIESVFDYVQGLRDWNERIIAKKLLLNYSYAKPFGGVFYKVFYPVSPEFMRSFGKAFISGIDERAAEAEAEIAVAGRKVPEERVMEITRELLKRIYRSVNAEIPNARKAGIEREVMLLRDVSIACPLHKLDELGVKIDINKEINGIRRSA